MVKVNFKLSEIGTVELNIGDPARFETILKLCSEETGEVIGPFIASSEGKVVNRSDLIEDNTTIDLFPAISGG